jgi:hypothetical protein
MDRGQIRVLVKGDTGSLCVFEAYEPQKPDQQGSVLHPLIYV